MSEPLRTYTFLPWLRSGIGGRMTTVDPLGPNPGGSERASVDITFDVGGSPVANRVSLVGPGDITGINPQAVVKTEPEPWITNFEPNYLPFIEFYSGGMRGKGKLSIFFLVMLMWSFVIRVGPMPVIQ